MELVLENLVALSAPALNYLHTFFARTIPFFSSDDIIPALIAAATLNSSTTAQYKGASIPCFVHVLHKLSVSKNVLSLLLASDDHSLSTLLNNTMKKLAVCEEERKKSKNK